MKKIFNLFVYIIIFNQTQILKNVSTLTIHIVYANTGNRVHTVLYYKDFSQNMVRSGFRFFQSDKSIYNRLTRPIKKTMIIDRRLFFMCTYYSVLKKLEYLYTIR